MAAFLQLIGMLAGAGIMGYVALRLMAHEQMVKKSAAKADKMIVDSFEVISKRLDEQKKLQKGNGDLLLMIEDLKREIREREL